MNALNAKSDFSDMGARKASISTVETYWGYIIRCQTCNRTLAILAQWMAAFVGVILIVLALSFWTLPGSVMSTDVVGFKLGMSTLLGVFGVSLFWFASHGTEYEIHVNLSKSELREVLRNRQGTVRVQNRIAFDKIGAVFIDRADKENGKLRLMLRLGNSAQAIEVARDYEENLTRLQERLGRDVLGNYTPQHSTAKRGFLLKGAQGVVKPELVA